MGFRLRFAALLGGVLLLTFSSYADDGVYRYRTRDGREVFTNAGRVTVGGEQPTQLALPPLTAVDLNAASTEQLQRLDQGVVRAHEALQSGERCEAIRASSRLPVRTHYLSTHLREVMVLSALVALSLIVAVGWGGRLRKLMPIPPLLGAAFLGYITYQRVDGRLSALREGLRACSSELPEGHSTNPETVKSRLESALSLQATVDRAYAQQSAQVEQYMHER